jgi:flagellar protein FliJ
VSASTFRFRLERVRAVRERSERLAQEELAKSISNLTRSEQQLQSAEETVEQARAERRDLGSHGAVNAAELQAGQAYIERTEAERLTHAAALRRSADEVAQRNASLVEAARDHEVLKRLRDRRRSEHDREVARQEENVLDEMATVRHGRSTA